MSIKSNWKSGLTVSLVSIPLSISLAVASGTTPVTGIITAIWTGLVGALCGGSNYNIIGPTGALSGIIASHAIVHGPESIPSLTLLSGCFMLIAYFCKLERYLVLIPSSVILGFTLGVACIIGLNQLNFALGLSNIPRHETLFASLYEAAKHIGESSLSACIVFTFFFIILFILRKLIPQIPGTIIVSPIGIIFGYLTTKNIVPCAIETLGSKFGAITPQYIPLPQYASFGIDLIMPALTIFFVAFIETILSAKIADGMTGTKHNTRKEIRGLACANIVSGLVGGMPATAALARTALNIKSGATSRMSGVLSSIFIALGSFFLLSYFYYMPMPVIAAILVYVAFNMIEHHHFERLWLYDKGNFYIALLVATITIYADPIIGIIAGIIISLLLLVKKISDSFYETTIFKQVHTPKDVLAYAFRGKLVYLNSQAHILRLQEEYINYTTFVLCLNELYYIDLDGVDAVEEIITYMHNQNKKVLIVQPNNSVKKMLHSGKNFRALESQGLVVTNIHAALDIINNAR